MKKNKIQGMQPNYIIIDEAQEYVVTKRCPSTSRWGSGNSHYQCRFDAGHEMGQHEASLPNNSTLCWTRDYVPPLNSPDEVLKWLQDGSE